jgi:hypothetical protein
MRPCLGLALAVVLASGCTHTQLRNSTLEQLATVSDLRYLEVLDNLARVAANPGTLPYFAVIDAGTTQVQDALNPSGSLTWDPHGLTQEMLNLNASRTLADQWTVSPIKDPDRLEAMRCAYLWALGGPEQLGPDCVEVLEHFLVAKDLAKIPPGWLRVGRKKDVPKHTCFVGHCSGVYVWVPPESLLALTKFTMVILDIATVDRSALVEAKPTQLVKQYYYKGDKIDKIVTYTEERKEAAPSAAAPLRFKPRRQRLLIIPGGLSFTPGAPAMPSAPVVRPR